MKKPIKDLESRECKHKLKKTLTSLYSVFSASWKGIFQNSEKVLSATDAGEDLEDLEEVEKAAEEEQLKKEDENVDDEE